MEHVPRDSAASPPAKRHTQQDTAEQQHAPHAPPQAGSLLLSFSLSLSLSLTLLLSYSLTLLLSYSLTLLLSYSFTSLLSFFSYVQHPMNLGQFCVRQIEMSLGGSAAALWQLRYLRFIYRFSHVHHGPLLLRIFLWRALRVRLQPCMRDPSRIV